MKMKYQFVDNRSVTKLSRSDVTDHLKLNVLVFNATSVGTQL